MYNKKSNNNNLFRKKNTESASAPDEVSAAETAVNNAQPDSTISGSDPLSKESQAEGFEAGAPAQDSSSSDIVPEDSGFDDDELALLRKNNN